MAILREPVGTEWWRVSEVLDQRPTFRWRPVRLEAEARGKRLRELEKENARLKRLLAERDVEVDVMKELLQKK